MPCSCLLHFILGSKMNTNNHCVILLHSNESHYLDPQGDYLCQCYEQIILTGPYKTPHFCNIVYVNQTVSYIVDQAATHGLSNCLDTVCPALKC